MLRSSPTPSPIGPPTRRPHHRTISNRTRPSRRTSSQYYQAPQPYGYGNVPKIPSHLGWAIATLILCFWPTGIVAVVYASQVSNKLAVGDFAGAKESSRKAKIWCWVTFGIAVGLFVLIILFYIMAAAVTYGEMY